MDAETAFLCGLIELQYGQEAEKKLQDLTGEIPWAKGWPSDTKAFWNAEAFMWGKKIKKEKRELIAQELQFLNGKKNLDLGCGAYSYIPSVGMDISEKMLQFNENCPEKIIADLEEELPVPEKSFDSVTAILVLNYIHNFKQLLRQVHRVLKNKGILAVVLASKPLNSWQRQKEVNSFSAAEWSMLIEHQGFKIDFYEKDGLWFFVCRKQKNY